jgi:uncharacterized membrane protein
MNLPPRAWLRLLMWTAFAIGSPITVNASDAGFATGEAQTYAKVKPVLERNCSMCHSHKPPFPFYAKAPAGVSFDSPQELARFAKRVLAVATKSDQMPPGNMTAMTNAERESLAAAIEAQWPATR